MPYKAHVIKPGDAMTPAPHNEAFKELERQSGVRGGGNVRTYSSGSGVAVAVQDRIVVDAKITGHVSGGQYNFVQVIADSGGAWITATYGGVAFERNANSAVATGRYVQLHLDERALEYRFDSDAC